MISPCVRENFFVQIGFARVAHVLARGRVWWRVQQRYVVSQIVEDAQDEVFPAPPFVEAVQDKNKLPLLRSGKRCSYMPVVILLSDRSHTVTLLFSFVVCSLREVLVDFTCINLSCFLFLVFSLSL